MSYLADAKRYDGAQFRRCGQSGIVLPPVSLGLWQNFGGADVFETGRAMVRRAFDRGKTIILTAMQCRWGPVASLCRRLEERFGCPVHTNLYLTPPGTQGFDPHYDTHEVFVLQIAGGKH